LPGGQRRSEELARLEAALFMAREPLTTRRLAKLARLDDGTRARALVKELRQLQDAAGSAFRVEQIAGGFQLLTRAPFGPWVRRLQEGGSGGRLSPAALETLAIVAYRQPVTRAEIESIRGVGSEEILRQLLERDFVAIGGRAEDLAAVSGGFRAFQARGFAAPRPHAGRRGPAGGRHPGFPVVLTRAECLRDSPSRDTLSRRRRRARGRGTGKVFSGGRLDDVPPIGYRFWPRIRSPRDIRRFTP